MYAYGSKVTRFSHLSAKGVFKSLAYYEPVNRKQKKFVFLIQFDDTSYSYNDKVKTEMLNFDILKLHSRDSDELNFITRNRRCIVRAGRRAAC